MLNYLQIRNFALIEQLALDVQPKLTVITGETGAGKSIMIDALSLCLGARADFKQIRPQAKQCEISAEFDLTNNPEAQQWLTQHEYPTEDGCILVRILTASGRSRSLINGRPCPLQHLRDLGKRLVDISSQHQHLNLLDTQHQRQLLDRFADNHSVCEQVTTLYRQWHACQQQIDHWQALSQDQADKLTLLNYHLDELTQLDLQDDEVKQLHQQFQQQQRASDLIEACQQVVFTLESAEPSAQTQLQQSIKQLQTQQRVFPELTASIELLNQAQIHIGEACQELQHNLNQVQSNPEQLAALEQRLDQIHALARKHQVEPEALRDKQQALSDQRDQLNQASEKLEQLQQQQVAVHAAYQQAAQQLRERRQTAANKLSKAVSAQLSQLGMPHGEFAIQLTPTPNDQPSASGIDQVEFWVTTNPGYPPGPLAKVASGGELSRISLVLSVLCGQQQATTQIFDEVDVGISGATAEIVGKLLNTLAQQRQILCITHLPQVAAQGTQHLQVAKMTQDTQTHVTIEQLDQTAHIAEIARLLGGVNITEQTLAHAKSLCEA